MTIGNIDGNEGKEGKYLTAQMLYYLFNAANMHRWNDHFRTVDFTELDKQSHKAMIAWILGKCQEDAGDKVDWDIIIEHSLFSFLQRVALTDLKPPVYYRIIRDKSNEVKLNDYAVREFKRKVPGIPQVFIERFVEYLRSEHDSKEDKIIGAAHYMATRYEFNLIRDDNRMAFDIDKTEREIDDQFKSYLGIGIVGMDRLNNDSDDLTKFVNLVGQLRCQQRWARAPREPKTTVLGHCVFVAIASYLNDLDHGVQGKQLYNDYYTGLFHDLPEVLTKDVITPVKTSSEGLPEVLGNIEREMFEENVEPLVPEGWVSDLERMALTPFQPVDGFERDYNAIKACDNLAAWIEAFVSIQYGISSKQLRDARVLIGYKLKAEGKGDRIGASEILRDFEMMEL